MSAGAPVDGAEQVWIPRRLRLVCRWSAIAVLVVVIGLTVALRSGSAANVFGAGDQLSLIAIGVVIAAALTYAGRPQVVAGAAGVRVRNMLGTRDVPWAAVVSVNYDEHSSWPSLELAGDEMITLLGIPRSDGAAAEAAVTELRRLHAASRVAASRSATGRSGPGR